MPKPGSDFTLLEECFDEYYDMLYRLASNILYQRARSAIDAADIVQEVFLKAIAQWDDFRSSPNPAGWLVVTTRNVCNNHIRMLNNQQIKTSNMIQQMLNQQPKTYGKLYDSAIEIDSSGNDLLDQLEEKLSPEDFALIKARYEDNLSFQEISQLTGIAEGTLRVRFHRIRKNISKIFILLVTFCLSQNI